MADTKNTVLLNLARTVNEQQEATGNWSEIYMRCDGSYMRFTNHQKLMAITVNIKADVINVEMSHNRSSIDKQVAVNANALNSVINTLHDDCLAMAVA